MGKKLRLETYKPKRKIKVSREETVPVLVRIGGCFLTLGGIISFAISGTIIGVKSFFDVKQKIYNKNILRRKYIELRVKKKR